MDYSSPPEDLSGANDESASSEVDTPDSHEGSVGVRSSSVSGLGAFAAIDAALLCLAFSPQVGSETFTPKFAVMLLLAAIGIVPLARLVMARSPLRWPARAAVAFLAVSLLSALVSPSPNIGIFGLDLWGTGWLLWAGAAGAFAIGASLGPNDRRWMFGGLLVGALGNAIIAVFQVVSNAQSGGLALYDARQADGVLGNPVHLEALLLGGLALILGRACRDPLRWAAAVLLLTVGLEFTSERLALVILAALVLYALYSYGVRRGGVFTVMIGAGYAIGYLGGGAGLRSRVTSGTGSTTFGTRIRIWVEGAHYVLHHPLLGAGPGQLRTAMDSVASLSFYQHVLAGKILTDGHDIFVEVGVTTGLLGLVCFVVWLFGAARASARCGFLGFAAAMIAVELVEPINVAILPLVFLGLGTAAAVRLRPTERTDSSPVFHSEQLGRTNARSDEGRAARPYAGIVTTVALLLALFLGVTMVVGDSYLFRRTNSGPGQPFNIAAAKDASRLLPYWPESAIEVAQVEAYETTSGGSHYRADLLDSRRWTAAGLGRDPRNPRIWTLLAGANVALKVYGLARADYYQALSCDKWYTPALEGLAQLAGTQGHWSDAVHWYRLALTTAELDPSPARALQGLLSRAESKARSASR